MNDYNDVINRIEYNNEFIDALIRLKDQETDVENRISLIELIGYYYSEYVTGIYASEKLEYELNILANSFDYIRIRKPNSKKYLLVMTGAYNTGGHTVLVNNWIHWDQQHEYSLVMTDMIRKKVPQFLLETIEKHGGNLYCLNGKYLEKAKELRNISQDFSRIILFQHTYDVIPNLAYGHYRWDVPVYLYNHAHFKFSYGYSVSDIVMNLCLYDIKKTSEYRGVDFAKCHELKFPGYGMLIGSDKYDIPFNRDECKRKVFEEYGISENTKLVVSMGADYKYTSIIGYDFAEFAKKLVNNDSVNIKFLIIGADKNSKRWLDLSIETSGRAVAIGELPRERAIEIICSANLYISSFPFMASGRTYAESAKVPFLFLDIIGRYANIDKNRVVSVEELIEKSHKILMSKNNGQYVNDSVSGIWKQNKWQKIWNNILTKYTVHNPIKIQPIRLIQNEELINCQLMQAVAGSNINRYMANKYYQFSTLIKIFNLIEEYDMHSYDSKYSLLDEKSFLYDRYDQVVDKLEYYVDICNKTNTLYKKCDRLYLFAEKWISLYIKGIKISDYLIKRGYRNIALYGYSWMGKNLAKDLKNSDICILCIIDKALSKFEVDRKINLINCVDNLKPVDVIVNTTAFDNMTILSGFNTSVPMISLLDIIDDLYNKNPVLDS